MRWLSIVGIGEDGLDGLSPAARKILADARLIIGGARHLALLGQTGAEMLVWPKPFNTGIDDIIARRGQMVCVLASSDPFLYGVGSVLAQHVDPSEMLCLPAPSSLSLAASRLGWALQDCSIVTLHGRDFERVIPFLQPRAKLLVLSWDGTTPSLLAKLLTERGMGESRFVVMEALGGPRERIREGSSALKDTINDLNLIAVEIVASRTARIIPRTPGLPDDWFESDGQITKREVRAITLSALVPWRGALLWDVGAGSGSVAIEFLLTDPQNRAIAIEARRDRVARIARNAAFLGVAGLTIVEGYAPDALAGLPMPDAVFVGGGGPEVIEAVYGLIPTGCRFVANAVTIEAQSALEILHAKEGGDLISIQIAHAEALGRYRGWRPAMGIVQWAVTKP